VPPAVSTPVATAPPGGTPAPPAAPKRSGVVFSGRTPAEMLASSPAPVSSDGFNLAPDPSKASPVLIGRMLEMRTPDGAAVFTMRTQQDIRAQAFPRGVPPAPFPAELAQFSEVYEVVADPPPAVTDTAIVIRVAPGAVAPERFGELKLYVFDAVTGWQAMDKQRPNAEAHSFSAMDINTSGTGVRDYVVLGPASR
jgi:hypothetical protein